MREIKFRAWLKKANKMETGLFNLRSDGKVSFNTDCILMQFTGLKDKNGKEIYEGDIIIQRDVKDCFGVIYYEKGIYEIKWHKFCFAAENYAINSRLYVWKEEELEIIGNLYKNPELLAQ